MTVGITGSRNAPDLLRFALWRVLAGLYATYCEVSSEGLTLVHGGALEGIDAWVEEWRSVMWDCGIKVPCTILRPRYNEFRGREKLAPLARNTGIVDASNAVYAFWDGKSSGTLDCTQKALRAGKLIEIHYPDGEILGAEEIEEDLRTLVAEKRKRVVK